MISGEQMQQFRERRNLSRKDLAEILNQSLGRNYTDESIGRWERGRPVSKSVSALMENLIASGGIDAELPPLVEPPTFDEPPLRDTEPGSSSPLPAQPPILTGSGAWAKACTELWELVATGVGMVGAATGNAALMQDGAIIDADKEALGAAWGKLAETNETLRKMLVGMTEGGAWLQVALVTGTTISKCWQGHAMLTEANRDGHLRDTGSADDLAA